MRDENNRHSRGLVLNLSRSFLQFFNYIIFSIIRVTVGKLKNEQHGVPARQNILSENIEDCIHRSNLFGQNRLHRSYQYISRFTQNLKYMPIRIYYSVLGEFKNHNFVKHSTFEILTYY